MYKTVKFVTINDDKKMSIFTELFVQQYIFIL